MDECIGPFRLLQEIGHGQNGAVFEAHDTRRDEVVALKVLQVGEPRHAGASDTAAGSPREEAALLRFVREADAIRRLQHPNIVRIRDAGAENGKFYIAMERLHGETLRTRLAQGPLPTDAAVGIGLQIASALMFAHEQGITHRDVKPDNIYLLPDGTAKLMDFGAARVTGENSLTQTGNVIGSPAYMAPEQVSGEQTDGRTDIWGLATTLFEAVTGTKPFAGESVAAVMYSILHKRPDFSLVPSPSLAQVLEKALAKKPAARYHTAAEFAEQLRCLPAPGCGPITHRPRSRVLHPAALLGGVVAALLLLGGLLLPRQRPEEARREVVVPPPASLPVVSAPPPRSAGEKPARVARGNPPTAPRPQPAAAPPTVLVEEWREERSQPASSAVQASPLPSTAAPSVSAAPAKTPPATPPAAPPAPVFKPEPQEEPLPETPEAPTRPSQGADREARPLRNYIPPALPSHLSDRSWEVRIRVDLHEDGRIREVSVADSSGNEEVNMEALRAVRGWQFMPARKNGRNVPSQTDVILAWE